MIPFIFTELARIAADIPDKKHWLFQPEYHSDSICGPVCLSVSLPAYLSVCMLAPVSFLTSKVRPLKKVENKKWSETPCCYFEFGPI